MYLGSKRILKKVLKIKKKIKAEIYIFTILSRHYLNKSVFCKINHKNQKIIIKA